MIALVVRFDVRDDAAARQFDELTSAVVARVCYEVYADEAAFQAHEHAPHVVEFHRRKDVLLDVEPRVEFLTPGPSARP